MKIAIIGAGMTGASAASWLVAAGIEVQVFDKGRSVGGRMSSKRMADADYIDMGAQYFTARDADFKAVVAKWQASGDVALWPVVPYRFGDDLVLSPDQQQRFVGVPAMQQPIKQLLANINVTCACRISAIKQNQHGYWQLTADDGRVFSEFTGVLITTPPAQALPLVTEMPELAAQIPSTILKPCWAVVLTVADTGLSLITPPVTAIFAQCGHLRWACQLQDKPGRQSQIRWLLHFSKEFTESHLTANPADLTAIAKSELAMMLKTDIEVTDSVCHRWLYATVDDTQPAPGILHANNQPIWLAGDWSFGGRIENAWLAGQQVAKQIACGL